MLRFGLLLVMVMMCLGLPFALQAFNSDVAEISLSPTAMELGDIRSDQPETIQFTLVNNGSKSVRANLLELSGGCMTCDFVPGEIPPGSATSFSIELNPRSGGPGHQSGRLFYDSHNQSIKFDITYNVLTKTWLEGSSRNLGIVWVNNATWPMLVPFKIRGGHDLSSNDANFVLNCTSGNKFDISVAKGSKFGADETLLLEVLPGREARAGAFRDKCTIEVWDAGKRFDYEIELIGSLATDTSP